MYYGSWHGRGFSALPCGTLSHPILRYRCLLSPTSFARHSLRDYMCVLRCCTRMLLRPLFSLLSLLALIPSHLPKAVVAAATSASLSTAAQHSSSALPVTMPHLRLCIYYHPSIPYRPIAVACCSLKHPQDLVGSPRRPPPSHRCGDTRCALLIHPRSLHLAATLLRR
jgi:hypothetical protein